ncbi:fungal-specific transcription factor domain-containing protein [Trametes punicea]|nr:fungal-specific transcription factor domain-containing protein [Trametes punicea]
MSSPEEGAAWQPKKRKVASTPRACDYCRRKKIKCDGPEMPNKRCSKCISRNAECTYVEPFQKSRYTDSYVENLKNRLQQMEELLGKLNVGADLGKAADYETAQGSTPKTSDTTATSSPAAASTSTPIPVSDLATASASPPSEGAYEEELSDDDAAVQRKIIRGINALSLQPSNVRYHGKSSGWVLIQATAGLQQEYLRGGTPSSSHQASPIGGRCRLSLAEPRINTQYPREPWLEGPFEDQLLSPEDFPPVDLMYKLVQAYFRHYNDYTPLLHEPTFLQNIRDELHLQHGGFGATVLLACANGARYVDDPGVLLEGSDSWHSAGWKWFQKVHDMHKSFLAPVHLYDLQICAMMGFFMAGTIIPHCAWTVIGLGLRKALDVGAHRKSMYKPKPTIEDELWRRAFWTLLLQEIWISYGYGRPPCIHEEEYDVALPTECDDEYWIGDEPGLAFKQPPDKPSKVAFFNAYIRLSTIIAYALRTIFSIRKTRTQFGSGDQQWEDRVVAELDSKLNKWADAVPKHLKWARNLSGSELLLGQSASLYAFYYTAQIAVHRSFITSRRGSAHSLASLIICTNAARSCVQILDQLRQRIGTPLARNGGLLFSCGLVLLMSTWGQKRSGHRRSAEKDQEYIHKCIDMLQLIERQYQVADRLRDTLQSFLSIDVQPGSAQEQPKGPSSAADAMKCPRPDPSPQQMHPRGEGDTEGQMKDLGSPEASTLASAIPFAPALGQQLYPPSFIPLEQPPGSTASGPSSSQGHTTAAGHHTSDVHYRFSSHPTPAATLADWRHTQTAQSYPGIMQGFPNFNLRAQDPGPSNSRIWPNSDVSDGVANSQGAVQYPESAGETNGTVGSSDSKSFPMGLPTSARPLNTEFDLNFDVSDFGFADDAMTMWSTAPSSFGWEDWDAYFNSFNGSKQPPGGY